MERMAALYAYKAWRGPSCARQGWYPNALDVAVFRRTRGVFLGRQESPHRTPAFLEAARPIRGLPLDTRVQVCDPRVYCRRFSGSPSSRSVLRYSESCAMARLHNSGFPMVRIVSPLTNRP